MQFGQQKLAFMHIIDYAVLGLLENNNIEKIPIFNGLAGVNNLTKLSYRLKFPRLEFSFTELSTEIVNIP